ncbi:MAG: hypothetical protein Q8936_10880 [Bacillota bacterium]|nr:hypothetical protein [Bacillota bacterium]
MDFFIELIIKTCIETLYLTGMIILIGFILGVLRNNSIRNFQRGFGSKSLMITGFIGVPIHELSHAIFALLFGHKITRIRLLQGPDESGVMGYVQHSYNQRSIYQQVGNFFVGIAPIFGGVFSIIALMRLIIPQSYSSLISILRNSLHVTAINKGTVEGIMNSYAGLIKVIFSLKNFENPYFYIFLFAAICISSHISLSRADIKGASMGLVIIFLILLVLNALDLTKYISVIDLVRYNILIVGILMVAIIFSLITFIISLISIMVRH